MTYEIMGLTLKTPSLTAMNFAAFSCGYNKYLFLNKIRNKKKSLSHNVYHRVIK